MYVFYPQRIVQSTKIPILTPSSSGPQRVTRSSSLHFFGISMLPFGTYPHRFFKYTITTIQQATSSPPASERLLSSSTMTSSKASPSPSPRPETSSHTPAPKALPDHEKFSVEERDFLRSHLLAYRAHCAELDRLGSGPRKLQGVKGDKKEWIYRHVYPEFSRKFSSGSNTQSLKQVCLATWVFYPAFGIYNTSF